MIIVEEVTIYISRRNIKYYKNKGYDAEIFNFLIVNVKDLPLYSKTKIECACDICGKQRMISYFEYRRYDNNYLCRKCSEKKRRETSLKNWGVDNPSKNDIIKEKISNSLKKINI
jgi:hypothetical protein